MTDIFLSYATAGRERVKPLVDALHTRGWTVWWDPVILPGQRWDTVIGKNLKAAGA